jgi:hypothetical protein
MKRRLFLKGVLGVTGTALCGAQIAPPKPEVLGLSFSKELIDDLQGMHRIDAVDKISKILMDHLQTTPPWSFVDDKSQLWYAPAGYNRGRLKAMELS